MSCSKDMSRLSEQITFAAADRAPAQSILSLGCWAAAGSKQIKSKAIATQRHILFLNVSTTACYHTGRPQHAIARNCFAVFRKRFLNDF
jgi:hypothetical protein